MKTNYRNIPILLIFLMISHFCFAQITIQYTYDEAGNRTERNVMNLKADTTSKNDTTEIIEITDFEELVLEENSDNLLQKNMKDYQISIYPNPTGGVFTVAVSGKFPIENSKFIIYNSKGQIILEKHDISPLTKVNISSQPSGAYFLQIHFDNDDKNEETTLGNISHWKIIKE